MLKHHWLRTNYKVAQNKLYCHDLWGGRLTSHGRLAPPYPNRLIHDVSKRCKTESVASSATVKSGEFCQVLTHYIISVVMVTIYHYENES
jgi:hypothetical protein